MGCAAIASLCLCMLTHSYLLISVFPYSGFLVVDLVASVDEESAGTLAGLLAAAFMLGRAATSMLWGRIADRYGRVFVLQASLILSAVLSTAFGVSSTFAAAVAVRFGLGCSNGIMAALKTIVSEMSAGNEKAEARNMSIVIGMWGLGFWLCPAASGVLAEPVKQYPDVEWLQQGTVGWVLERFPFLLPNLLGAWMCIVSSVMLATFVRETLPEELRSDPRHIVGDFGREVVSWMPNRYQYRSLPVLKEHESENDFSERSVTGQETEQSGHATMASLWARDDTRLSLMVYWGYSFIAIAVDEAFPLFCMSRRAGFGLSEMEIGKILSFCGLVFVIMQYAAYSSIYDRFGLLGAVRAGSILSAPIVLLTPISLLLNRGAEDGTLKSTAFFFLGAVLAFHRVFSLAFFSSIAVLMNRTVPASQRATMNGLSQIGGSVAKGMGPAFAGLLVSQSVAYMGRAAPVFIFGVMSFLGVLVALSTFVVLRADSFPSCSDEDSTVELVAIEEQEETSKA